MWETQSSWLIFSYCVHLRSNLQMEDLSVFPLSVHSSLSAFEINLEKKKHKEGTEILHTMQQKEKHWAQEEEEGKSTTTG